MEHIKLLDQIIPGYAEKFLLGQIGQEEMPLLAAVEKKYLSEINKSAINNIYILACQHMLEPQLRMFNLFIKAGINASHIMILPKVYSSNEKIINELIKIGCNVRLQALAFDVNESFDNFHRQQCRDLIKQAVNYIPSTSKLIILDDGGMLLDEFAKCKAHQYFMSGVFGVEQTNSGKNILLNKNLPLLITSVASSIEKIEIETRYIIRHSLSRIEEYFASENISKEVGILILGRGPIGKALIDALLRSGYRCDSYDKIDGKFKINLSDYDVIIGATGSNSLKINQLSLLKQGCHLISVSSSDREFSADHIRRNSISGRAVHDTFVYKNNDIKIVNGGFPITFKGCRFECFPREIDVTIMKLCEAVFHHVLETTKIDSSVNHLYGEKKLYNFGPLISSYFTLLMITCLLKLIFYGFVDQPPAWIMFLAAFILAYGCIPSIWFIKYTKKLGLFVVKKV